MLAMTAWISLGPGARQCTAGASNGAVPELACRFAFGVSALILGAMLLLTVRIRETDLHTPNTPTPKSGRWIAIGIAIGLAIGVAMHNIGVGIAIGVALGIAMSVARRKRGETRADKDRGV